MQQNFIDFIEKIKLTTNQKEDAKIKTKNVCETLHAKYYPTVAYDGSTKLLIGSYGKHTHIRPPKDIDILFKMPDSEFSRYDSMAVNGQSQLLQDVRQVLKGKFVTTEKISAWGKVIVINFSEGRHTVELLPAWVTESKTYKIPDAENGGMWHIWDPSAEIKNISESDSKTGMTKSLIRIIKCWAKYSFTPVPSYILEILVVNYLKEKFDNDVDLPWSEIVLRFFEFMKTKKNTSVFCAGYGNYFSLGESWYSRVERACSRAQKANEYESKGKLRDASLEWQKVFGGDFLVSQDPIFSDELEVKILSLTRSYPSVDEHNITRSRGYPVIIDHRYQLTLDASVTYQKGFSAGSLSSFLARKFPLLKGNKLLFQIKKITVPTPYTIFWKVRNFGREAKDDGGLRGQIYDDHGSLERKESTKYEGEHYVECYAVKDNVCVAIARILVPIGKDHE